MINRKKIQEVFDKTALCPGVLIKDRGLAQEYCAVGALARHVGMSDERLRDLNTSPNQIEIVFKEVGDKLREVFGIESHGQLMKFMGANDGSEKYTVRKQDVMKAVEAMSPEEVNSLLDSVDALVSEA